MASRGEPQLVVRVLTVLANKYKFRPTRIVAGQKWSWRSALGAPLVVNLPSTVHPIFTPDGAHAWVSHEKAYFSEQYTALLIDSARSIAENVPRQIQPSATTRVVFSAIKADR